MNICLLLIDALRQDHLGCYGYTKNTSPNIDAIAGKGITFLNAFAQSNWTYPSVYSMITGRLPSVLGVTWFDQKINRSFATMPEFLAKRGYRTGIFSPFKVLLNRDAFCSHFQEMKELHQDDKLPEAFRDWNRTNADSFLLLHMAEYVHEPFCAATEAVAEFLEDKSVQKKAMSSEVVRVLTSSETSGNALRKTIGRLNRRLPLLSKKDVEYLLACYDAGIRQTDKMVGVLHDVLREEGKPYLLIIAADHGQLFMEHGVFGHGLSLHDELIRVPLIVDYQGCTPRRVSSTVQLMDILPTIMEFQQQEYSFKVDGTSFAPAFDGHEMEGRTSVSEGFPNVALIKDNHKLVSSYSKLWNHSEVVQKFGRTKTSSRLRNMLSVIQRYCPARLYDLGEDRHEKANLRWRRKDTYEELNALLRKIMSGIQDDALPPEDKELEDALRVQLERLGYL